MYMEIMKTYNGPLDSSGKEMNKKAKMAYKSWISQRQRCYNKNNHGYKYYGFKGIRVLYSSREFIAWWINQQTKLNLKDPTTSRINHSDHYRFGNIRLETRSDNSKERIERCGPLKRARPVTQFKYPEMKLIRSFKSIQEASIFTGKNYMGIRDMCNGKNAAGVPYRKTKDGFTFRFMEQNAK